MAIQLVDKSGVIVECATAEDLVAFFASNANANIDVKKEIAKVVNLSNQVEESLLLGGSKELALTVIAGFFKGVGGQADAGDDAQVLAKIFGGEFTDTDAAVNADLLAKMVANKLVFKYVGTDVLVVDATGTAVTSIPTRDASGVVIVASVKTGVDADGNDVFEDKPVMEDVNFTVSNKLALCHLANFIAATEGLSADDVKREIETSILDNTNTPKSYVDQYLHSSDPVLFNKALVHPNSDSAAQLASIKTNALYPLAKKLDLISAIANAEQFAASSDLMKFFLDKNGLIGDADKATLQKATFLKLVNLSIDAFNASLAADVQVTVDELAKMKATYLPSL